jgi:CRP/FNR family transcriptional regulator
MLAAATMVDWSADQTALRAAHGLAIDLGRESYVLELAVSELRLACLTGDVEHVRSSMEQLAEVEREPLAAATAAVSLARASLWFDLPELADTAARLAAAARTSTLPLVRLLVRETLATLERNQLVLRVVAHAWSEAGFMLDALRAARSRAHVLASAGEPSSEQVMREVYHRLAELGAVHDVGAVHAWLGRGMRTTVDPWTTPQLLRRIEPQQLEVLRATATVRRCSDGATVARLGTPTADLYLVLAGELRVSQPTAGGIDACIRSVQPGEMIGASHDEAALWDCDLVTSTECVVAVVEARRALALRREHPWLANLAARSLQRQLDRLARATQLVAAHAVRERVAHALLEHASEQGTDTVLLTREQIAQRVASSRETVTRAIRELEAIGLLDRRGTTLIVPDTAQLADHLARTTGLGFDLVC